MNTFQQTASKLWYILLCTLVISCGDSSELPDVPPVTPSPEPEPTPVEKEYKLADNVIELEGNRLKYVSFVKGDTLMYDSNTPANELPKVGEIILVTQPTEVFPTGFLGKVTEIAKNGTVITEAAALDEAFTYLNIEGSYELESKNTQSRSNVDGISHKMKGEVSFNFPIITGSLSWGLDAILEVNLNIDKRSGKNIRTGYIDIDWDDYLNLKAALILDNDKDEEKDEKKELGKGINLGLIQVGPITIQPVLQPFLGCEMKGEIEIGCEAEIRNKHKVRANFDGNSWSMIPLQEEEKIIDYNVLPNIKMEGSAFYGVGMALEFRLYGNKNINVSVSTQAGLEASGEIKLATEPENIYNELSDAHLTMAAKGGIDMGATAKIFIIKLNWEHSLINKTWWEEKYYVFPSFEECMKDCSDTGITASTVLKRDLLWNNEVGIGLYDGEKFVEVSEPQRYRFEEDFEEKNPLEVTFKGLTKEEIDNYSVWTYVKWGEEYLKCKRLGTDIIGLWCKEGSHRHLEFLENGIVKYYNKKDGVWINYYSRPWAKEGDNMILIYDDADWELDEIWEITEVTSDSLIVLDWTDPILGQSGDSPYIMRFHRLNNNSECTKSDND